MPRRGVLSPFVAVLPALLLVGCAGDDVSAETSASTSASTSPGATEGTATVSTTETTASTTDVGTESGTSATTGVTSTSEGTTTTTSGTTTTTAGETDTTTGGPPPLGVCEPLPPPRGEVLDVTPDDAASLPQIVADAAEGTTIRFADGTYDVSSGPLHITRPGITLRSASSDPDAVNLDAGYAVGEIVLVEASDVTLAEITLRRAMWHPIHVTGGAEADTTGVLIHRVRVVDPGQQGIKINASGAGHYADDGVITCSEIVLTDAGRAQIMDNCYTGGIDAHSARGWIVADNTIEGFWCEQGLSEHAIHFWVTGRDTLVERNRIVDCARGVGFGLGEMGNGKSRTYDDDPCPGASYLGHVDGLIRNNMIVGRRPELFASQSGMDSGIALEQACGAEVYHNTIVALQPPFVSMEYRWGNTSATIKNNLVTHNIKERDGGQAELAGNLEGADPSAVVDAGAGDLHLAPASPAIDAGVVLAPGACDEDLDEEPRSDGMPDVGADEVG
ncbi:MAG: right-handed parallel beta-helix repeat-containing protein [Nannocystaceae bacterium]